MAKTTAKKTTKPKSSDSVLKIGETVLQKLEALNLDQKLQSEIQWCIGSFKHDKNPVGLLEKLAETLPVLKVERAKKTKGITAKLIGDIEKALAK
jgi:hypothetical protein